MKKFFVSLQAQREILVFVVPRFAIALSRFLLAFPSPSLRSGQAPTSIPHAPVPVKTGIGMAGESRNDGKKREWAIGELVALLATPYSKFPP